LLFPNRIINPIRIQTLKRIAIVAARRTPQGRFLGGLAKITAVELATTVGNSILENLNHSKELTDSIDQVILGNVLSAGMGMNLARQVAIGLKLPITTDAFTVNMMCASGMKAIMLGCDAVRSGSARMVLCGGTESMSQAPYLLPRVRTGLKLGDSTLVDSILRDGLVDSFDHQHMGLSAERLAREYVLSREEQDLFAFNSQQLYAKANAEGAFHDELVGMGPMRADEHPRSDTTIATLSKLAPAFDPEGTVTAGNASGLNDGAALVLICEESFAIEHNIDILACVDYYATVGCEPARMGLGPVFATQKLLKLSGLELSQFDTVELNEAFAAQALACLREMPVEPEKLNPDGGAIAIGHPIGATGARLVVHLAHRIAQSRTRRGLATLCVGGGMGAAISLASPQMKS
jgi:acetyl-CoA C-acetyltransferase